MCVYVKEEEAMGGGSGFLPTSLHEIISLAAADLSDPI